MPTATASSELPGGFVSHGLADYLRHPITLIRGYRRRNLTPDLIAGVTVAAVAIPQAIAYASIAELPAQVGLYAAATAAIVGSLWGSSRHLATGPVNAVSLLVLPILLALAEPGTATFLIAAATLAVMVGLLELGLAVMRFGALITLASRSVLLGFTAGAAVHIAVGQLKHLLRVEVAPQPELYNTAIELAERLSQTHPISLALGLGTLAALILLRLFGPRVPAALVAIGAAAAVVGAFALDAKGVAVVGAVPRSLPPLTWTSFEELPDLATVRALLIGALAVTALGLVEAVASAQSLARQSGDRIDANQEFFGQGLANLAAGFLSGYPCSGSFTRSSVALQVGGRTRLTGVVTGLTILAGMLLLAPLAHYIPRAAIAGVLFAIAWGMVDRKGIRRVMRTSRSETAIVAITFAATLILPLDVAVLSGVLFSLAFFVVRSSLPRVYQVVPDAIFRHLARTPKAPVCPQLGIVNIRGPLFFGAVHHIEEELRHNLEDNPGQTHLMLRMHGVDFCDMTGIEMLESMVKTYRGFGGDVYLVRPRLPVLRMMRSSGFLGDTLGEDHLLEQEEAIEYLFDNVLDPLVCTYECDHRVFAECQAIEKHDYDVTLPGADRKPLDERRQVDVETFCELIEDGHPLVLDLREQEEYDTGHVPGSELLPLRTLIDEAPRLPRNQRRLLLVSRSGRRTERAMYVLRDLGFDDVYGLRGGILAWRAAGMRLAISPPEHDASAW